MCGPVLLPGAQRYFLPLVPELPLSPWFPDRPVLPRFPDWLPPEREPPLMPPDDELEPDEPLMPPDDELEPGVPLLPPGDELEPGEPLMPPRVAELPMPSSFWLPRSVRLPNEPPPGAELPGFPESRSLRSLDPELDPA